MVLAEVFVKGICGRVACGEEHIKGFVFWPDLEVG
jgi:hypothetical protein